MIDIARQVLRFEPDLHVTIWGGDAIASLKGLHRVPERVGESWEVSALPGCESVVADGPLAGCHLTELVERYGESLVGHAVADRYGSRFPLLVKFIDAHADLSLQVHPDDELAARCGGRGKTEMWYIVDTRPGARIDLGLSRSLTPGEYDRLVAENSIMDIVGRFDTRPGDSFYVPAGRIHAIGAGNLLVEVQQSSDITYRIYDYDRVDSNGCPRELHTEAAREAIKYDDVAARRNTAVPIDAHSSRIIDTEHFAVCHVVPADGREYAVDAHGDSFVVLVCIAGDCTLLTGQGVACEIAAGQSVLVPAASGRVIVGGAGEMLAVSAVSCEVTPV